MTGRVCEVCGDPATHEWGWDATPMCREHWLEAERRYAAAEIGANPDDLREVKIADASSNRVCEAEGCDKPAVKEERVTRDRYAWLCHLHRQYLYNGIIPPLDDNAIPNSAADDVELTPEQQERADIWQEGYKLGLAHGASQEKANRATRNHAADLYGNAAIYFDKFTTIVDCCVQLGVPFDRLEAELKAAYGA